MSERRLTAAEYEAIGQHLDALVREFEALPYPDIQAKAFDLLQTIDAVHRESLQRLVAFLRAHGQADLVDQAAADPIIRMLFLLYDLVPIDERTEVETALEIVRPYIHSHGGEVEVLDVVDGIVHLRLSGACEGCPGSTMTLTRGIEGALREGFAGFKGVQLHEPAPSRAHDSNIIPLQVVGQHAPRPSRAPVFKQVARIDDVPPGALQAFDVDGARVLVANMGGEFYAFRNTCPGSVAPLELGVFTPPIVTCPWHNEAYDVRTGKRADGSAGPGLTIVPVAIVDDTIQVAVNTLDVVASTRR